MKLTTLLLFLFTLTAFAQSKIVSNNGTPIEYVNIGIVGTHKGVISDEHGNFFLEKLAPKPADSVYFSHISYERRGICVKGFQNDKPIILTEKKILLSGKL